MSISRDGSTVMKVCCHSNGYNNAAIVLMHLLNVLDTHTHHKQLLCTTASYTANVSHHLPTYTTAMTVYLLQT